MRTPRLLIAMLFLFVSNAPLIAATTDPSGHWEGLLHAPGVDVRIEVDLWKDTQGKLSGTFNNLTRNVRGFPLSNVTADGTAVAFAIKADGGGAFAATLSADARSMKGQFTTRGVDGQPLQLPFDLTRTGDAKIEVTPKTGAVSKELEGAWSGTLDVDGQSRRIALDIRNHGDGTSSCKIVTNDGVEIGVTHIEQKGSTVALDVQTIGGAYAGTVNAEGTELAGTWKQGAFVAPLNFRRGETAVDRWANAVGGRQKVGAVTSTYREATIDVGGMQGTIRVWHTADGKYRKEEQIAGMSIVEIFDGVAGTLQQGDSPARAMTAVEVERARSQAFANWNATLFAFFPGRHRGTAEMEGNHTIVLAPHGGVVRRVILHPQTALPATMTHQYGGRTITVQFIAYETVEGMMFEKEIHRSTGDARYDAVIRFTKTVINPPVEPAMFASAS
jgi:hypothetical protein